MREIDFGAIVMKSKVQVNVDLVGGYMVQGVVKLVKRVLLSLNVVLDGGDVERDGG